MMKKSVKVVYIDGKVEIYSSLQDAFDKNEPFMWYVRYHYRYPNTPFAYLEDFNKVESMEFDGRIVYKRG